MDALISKILEKKELRDLDPDFLQDFLEKAKKKKPKLFKTLEEKNYNEKSKEFQELKKIIRKKLREVHGVFRKTPLSKGKREQYLKDACSPKTEEEAIQKILENHQSTAERASSYTSLFSRIQEIQPNTKKVLDLGCGYNPFTYSLWKTNPFYIAVDINKEDQEFIQEYFTKKSIPGKAVVADLTTEEAITWIKDISKGTTALLFKLLDSMETKKKNSSKKLLEALQSDTIIISFATKTISGKGEIKAERKWLQETLNHLNTRFIRSDFDLDNEAFIVLRRK